MLYGGYGASTAIVNSLTSVSLVFKKNNSMEIEDVQVVSNLAKAPHSAINAISSRKTPHPKSNKCM